MGGGMNEIAPTMIVLAVVAVPFVFAWITGAIAESKGHSFWGWFILSLFLPFLALLIILVMPAVQRQNVSRYRLRARLPHRPPSAPERFSCPQCGESIPYSAKICRFCRAEFVD